MTDPAGSSDDARPPELLVGREELEALRKNPDDLVGLTVQREHVSDRIGLDPIRAHPVLVPELQDLRASLDRLGFREQPPSDRSYLHDLEEGRRHLHGRNRL